jgi:lysine 2,3-aminomutase
VKTVEALERLVRLTDDERRGLTDTAAIFRLGITPYYAALMDPEYPFCPVRMQAIPVAAEAEVAPLELRDPLGEDKTRPAKPIVHKYPDRVLFLLTDRCSVYCRHCTRRRITSGDEGGIERSAIDAGLAYIRAHAEVRDVLLSGGDPLILSDDKLGWILGELKAIAHVEMIRIGTRVPVTCPMRVNDPLAKLLRAHAPVFVITHFNHPKELTPEARTACELLVDHGVPVENQNVLLRRVNSSARTILALNRKLLSWRVRPYYLHQGDMAEGTDHLRTPLACGLDILEQMRGHTTGLAVPHLAVDLPGGGGKVTIQPEYRVEPAEGGHWFRNFRGRRYFYPEPKEQDCSCPYDAIYFGA